MAIIDPFKEISTQTTSIVDPFKSNIVDPFQAAPEQEQEREEGADFWDGVQDVIRFMDPGVTTGLNAIGTAIGAGFAGESPIQGAIEGAAKETFLGAGLGMETEIGKKFEEVVGNALTAVRDFGARAPELFTDPEKYKYIKYNPATAPLALIYENLSPENKTKFEATISAGAAATPEALLIALGGRGAQKVADRAGAPKPQVETPAAADILTQLQQEAAANAPTPSITPDLFPETLETPFGTQTGTVPQWTLDENGMPVRRDLTSEVQRTEMAPLESEFARQAELDRLGAEAPLGAMPNNLPRDTTPLLTPEQIPDEAAREATPLTIELTPIQKELVLERQAELGMPATPFQMPARDPLTNLYEGTQLSGRAQPTMESVPFQGELKLGDLPAFRGQRGAIGQPRKPKTIEELATTLPKDKWTEEFNRQFPGNEQFADAVYDRLQVNKKVGGPKVNERVSDFVDTADFYTGIVSTRLGNLSPRLKQVAQNFELASLQNTSTRLKRVDDFLTNVNKFSDSSQKVISTLLLNNDYTTLAKNLPAEMKKGLAEVRTVLNELGADLKRFGVVENLRQDYFPRIVSDYKGLQQALGISDASKLENMIRQAEIDAKRRGQLFSEIDRAEVINKFMAQRQPMGQGGVGFKKSRKLDEVPAEFEKFYASPTESLHSYIRSATHQIEAAKFFGKSLAKDPMTKKIDLNTSIGKYIDELVASGNLKMEDVPKAQRLLEARFGPGQAAANIGVQTYKDLNNLTLLNDITNTITQAGDIAPTLVMAGIRPTLRAIVQQLRKKNPEDVRQLGIIDYVAEEFAGDRWTTRKVNQLFKGIGFSQFNRFMQNVLINANRIAREREAVLGKPDSRLYRKYQDSFGPDFPQLVDDLQNGRKTLLTDQLLFSELSTAQPISKLEKTEFGLRSSNVGGAIYSLKSFLLKQADFVRNEMYKDIKSGDPKRLSRGLKTAALYSLYAGTSMEAIEALKNWLTNKPIDSAPIDVLLAVPRMFGLNQYLSEDLKRGDIPAAIGGIVLPPYQQYSRLGKEALGYYGLAQDKLLGEDFLEPRPQPTGEALRYLVPGVGDILYGQMTEAGKERRTRLEEQMMARELGMEE